jgi:hypothetical protein
MNVETVSEAVECPECGVGNEQGLFHLGTGAVKVCSDCLMKLCTATPGSRLPVTISGVTDVRLYDNE